MHVDLYEKIWMYVGAAIVALFLTSILVPAAMYAVHPPSHIETVDPTALAAHPEFAAGAVRTRSDGRVVATVIATMFAFDPDPIEVPANTPVTFRITSGDVVHGFNIAGTNANTMAIPGYVSQFTYTFPTRGEFVITCHEYCGLMHHAMVGRLIVK